MYCVNELMSCKTSRSPASRPLRRRRTRLETTSNTQNEQLDVNTAHRIRWHLSGTPEVSSRTGLAPVSDLITSGRNAISGHVQGSQTTLPHTRPYVRQVELSAGRLPDLILPGGVNQVDRALSGPIS